MRAASRQRVLAILLLGCLTTPARAQDAPDLRGVWRLVSITDSGRDVPMNALMFLTKQYYARVTVDKDREKFVGFDFRKPESLTLNQQRLVAMTFPRSNSNGGTYRVVGDTFYFTALAHQNPNAEGQEFRRKLELKGNRLRLVQESDRKAEEVWERVEDIQ